ncbi:signal peptidase I [Leptotrichia sp. oral taxon 847]|uniref:signal peptidase I n=1 Tax=Leptotrichia sp. oral taxon 847 TaxID=1785996 RepID=UPI0007684714|nr:signal peptidase I [Leptotrichia sp. oral taxon 847]AMD95940.1 hypothetical protein AXF11_10350 [Leptotrichia sp. oral taxon 847]
MKNWQFENILKYKKKVNKGLLIFWILFVLVVISYLLFTQLFWVNVSPSIPLGIYREIKFKDVKKGDIVVFKMDENFEKYSSTKNIKNILTVKKIVAVYGDKLEVQNNHLFVNGEDYGEYIKGIERAKLNISKDGYWVLSKEKYSLDSRYFGEIKKKDILKKVKLVYKIKI